MGVACERDAVPIPRNQDTEAGQRSFPTTVWDDVARAQGEPGKAGSRVLEHLIKCYWHPVYFFIRHKGRSREEAKDLTQGFFASFLDKSAISYADENRGKFRNFLLACVCRYLAQEHRRDSRLKRTGSSTALGPDEESWEGFELTGGKSPETIFMRNWAKRLVECCVEKLCEECRGGDGAARFNVFRARFLEAKPLNAKAMADQLGIPAEDIPNLLRWAKRRFARILHEEVCRHVTTPEEAGQEIGELLAILGQ